MDFDIRDFGAIPNSEELNTIAIQKAIDECATSGGGRVLVSGGRYLTGTIVLKNNVNLHIAADAVLLGSTDCSDFPERLDIQHVNSERLPRNRNACMIYAECCKNISITGNGTIDCNGHNFVVKKKEVRPGWKYDRIDAPTPPRVVFFTGCQNVTVEDVTMTNQPAGWSYWIHDCDYITFDKVKIIADVDYPNNDGIHINSSRNVTISNSNITCGDDCLVVRANNSSLAECKVCEKVSVTNCNLTSYSAGIRVGWINDGTIRNCTFSNLVMTDCSVGVSILIPTNGLSDEGREATLIENMNFDNIIMDRGNSNAIVVYIHEGERNQVEAIRNLYFNNIHARSVEMPYISGRQNNLLRNIYFNNCSFERCGVHNPLHGPDGVWIPDAFYSGCMQVNYTENLVLNNTTFHMATPVAREHVKIPE